MSEWFMYSIKGHFYIYWTLFFPFSVSRFSDEPEGWGGETDEARCAEGPEPVHLGWEGATLWEGEELGSEETQHSAGAGKT